MEGLNVATVFSENKIAFPTKVGLKKGQKLIIFQTNDILLLKKISPPTISDFTKFAQWGRAFAKNKKINIKDIIADD
jgi:hypothetical protein